MKKKTELLAPGGDIDSIKAAIIAGADAVYCGLDKFNARSRAENIILDDLYGVINLAHKNKCKIYLTLNIIILENEVPALIKLLNKLINSKINGLIVQDLGLFYILSEYFKNFKIHASTQCTTHNEGQINFLKKLNVSRINLSRELNINEIRFLTEIAHKNKISTEVFVHGSYCISFSGICYMSSVHGARSGNRGRCSQPCRDKYLTTQEGRNYPLNLKDNSAYFDLKELSEAGVDALKIEGRMKKPHYVYTVVNCWRIQLKSFYDHNRLITDNSDLYKVFNRDFSNSYLAGNINKDMFIDDPRDNSIKYLSKTNNNTIALYDEKSRMAVNIKRKTDLLKIEKTPLVLNFSGKVNSQLKVSVKTPDILFNISSETALIKAGKNKLDHDLIYKKFKTLNNSGYFIKDFNFENLQEDLHISFKEITSIRNRILSKLYGSEYTKQIVLPLLQKEQKADIKPKLSILISSKDDLTLCKKTSANIFYQVPSCLNNMNEIADVFSINKNIFPWFPSILIGENYKEAIKLLNKVRPKLIITNNTGIAYEAYKNNIPWIAGPYLNIINSYSLLNLKENYDCKGAFISNEINRDQIKRIIKPDDFELYYSIYHPILLMTSRQCLHFQTTGCKKNSIDNDCIQNCDRSSSITNLKEVSFLIRKTKGNYQQIYNNINFLNTDIISDIHDKFSSFFIDLRNIKTETILKADKEQTIKLFKGLLNSEQNSKKTIKQIIYPTINDQYIKGI